MLAIDYDVVSRGVKEKYGNDIGEVKGRSFFDKIIQVPFSLPVGEYDLSTYIVKLINDSDLTEELSVLKGKDGRITQEYIDIIRYSIGSNPRSIKRLINTFRLLTYIMEENSEINYAILFETLCMQLAYEKVYNYLLENSGSKKCIEEFFGVFKDNSGIENIDKVLQQKMALNGYTDVELDNLYLFIETFYMSLNNLLVHEETEDGEITEEVAVTLKNTLKIAAITATVSKNSEIGDAFDTKIEDIFATVKYVKEQMQMGKEPSNKLFSEARNAVAAAAGKNSSCVASECTRGLNIKADDFQEITVNFLNKIDEKLVETIIMTNKNKKIRSESIKKKFEELVH